MLAYLFWHRPLESADVEAYEGSQVNFHRSLRRSPPVGMRGSAAFRLPRLPFLASGDGTGGEAHPGYEDWYLVEDFAALGVLNEAAVGVGHRTAHDGAARSLGAGAGGLYGLVEGDQRGGLESICQAAPAVWVERPAGSRGSVVAELLGDGMEPGRASLWRRQLVLGPAPELCLLSSELPTGVAPTRLPEGWKTIVVERELLWGG
ncbi:MAG TPA: hypothetical protein VG010_07205 [Solirubrobacteraceae bacterium]|nr:hypothetical protein [Solirubrobacteraceae bacterium]